MTTKMQQTIPSAIQSIKQDLADAVRDMHKAASAARLALGQLPPTDPVPVVLSASALPQMLGVLGNTSADAVQAFADLREAIGGFVGGLASPAGLATSATVYEGGAAGTEGVTGEAHEQNGRAVVKVGGQRGRGRGKR